jgi:hypothetical protein
MSKAEERAYQLELEELKTVMSSESGRNVMHRLIEACGVYRISYNPNLPESNTVFMEGQRNIGLMMIGKLQEASPGLFVKMIEEHKDETN